MLAEYKPNSDSIEMCELSSVVSALMQEVIVELWEECVSTIGAAPIECSYAIIAFSPMARNEMTPYSDFEWGILISDPNPAI